MWHFFRGYVIIQIEGDSIAAFLRTLSNEGISLRNVSRTDERTVLAEIPLKRFFDLRKLKRGRRLRIHIRKRAGFPFLLKKALSRPVLLWGAIAALIALFVLSQRIWLIRIEGNDRIESEEILALLSEHSLTVGSRPKGPVLITAANDLSARIRDAAWIGLDREGITLHVTVKESIPKSPTKTDRVPYDILAEKDGVVTSITVMRGQARVKPGDRVRKGDVLISGTVRYKDESYETNADGIVYAAVRYEAESPLPQSVREAHETGNTQPVRIVRIGPWELFRSDPSFEFYRRSAFETVGSSSLLPVFVDRATAFEIIFEDRLLDQTEAEELALVRARETVFESAPKDASIINQYGTIRSSNGKQTAYVVVTAEEIIGRTEEIPNDG